MATSKINKVEMSATASQETVGTPHFYFLDALRGAAAVGVMLYHLGICHAFSPLMWRDMPPLLPGIFILASHGVEIFFLLSGFVITYSMCRLDSAQKIPSRSLSLFLIRRWVRLTPAYWAACLLAAALIFVEAKLTGEWASSLNFPTILANLFYVQSFFGLQNLFAPAWSLVAEVQFYGFFALIFWCCFRANGSARLLYGLTFCSGIISLLWPWIGKSGGFFVSHWCHFAAGVLIYLTLNNPKLRLFTALYLSSILMAALAHFGIGHTDLRSESFAMAATFAFGTLIWVLAERQLLSSIGRGRTWQWLGKISYSLYLIHMQLGIFMMKSALKIGGERAIFGWLAFFFTCTFCLIVAHVFHLCVEQPTIRWSKQLKAKAA